MPFNAARRQKLEKTEIKKHKGVWTEVCLTLRGYEVMISLFY